MLNHPSIMLICNHTTFHLMKVCVQHHISLIYNGEIINIISIIYSFEDILIDNRKDILFSNQKRKSNNDPSAGSPTNTLLRLLLPLFGKVYSNSPQQTHSHKRAKTSVCYES